MRIQDVLAPQGMQGFGTALQEASPLLLAMGQGLSQGKGVGTYMPQGLAAMMAQSEKRAEKEKAEALSQAAESFGMNATERALFDSMDLAGRQSMLGQLTAERRARANRVGRAPSQADIANAYASSLGGGAPAAPQGGVASGLSMGLDASAPVASAGGLSFGSAVQDAPQAQGMPLGMAMQPAAPQAPTAAPASQPLAFAPGIGAQPQQAPERSPDVFAQMEQRLMADLPRIQADAQNGVPGAAQVLNQRIERIQQLRELMPQASAPKQTEADQELARLQSIGMSYDEAVKLKEGVYKVITDPTTKETILFDVMARQIVRPVGDSAPAAAEVAAPAAPQASPLNFGTPYTAAQDSFGVEGAAKGLANAIGDTTGLGVPFPEVQQTQIDFSLLQENLLNDIASGYPRQPPSWLMQEIRKITPTPGSVTQGPEAAQKKLTAIARFMNDERNSAIQQLSGRQLSPQARMELEARLVSVETAMARIGSALGAFKSSGASQQTSTGIKWGIVE